MRQTPKGRILDGETRERLTTLVNARGANVVARAFSVSDHTIARAAAGMRVNPSTAALIRFRLDDDDES